MAVKYINAGTLQGYLAFHDEKVVGWCNANTKSECINCVNWRLFLSTVKITDVSNESVKSVFCFTVAPEYKRKGVATLLLRRICEDAKRDYFDYVEAYPNKEFIDEFQDYMGPYELYRKLGFFVYQDAGNMLVVRKKLKP